MLCSYHISEHMTIQVKHSLKRMRLVTHTPDPYTKRRILLEINQLKQKANEDILMIVKYTNGLIVNLQKYSVKHILQLRSFIRCCNTVVRGISEISEIPSKDFYNPLERALMMDSIEDLISKLRGPKLDFSSVKVDFLSYTLPTFPHALFNYSYFSGGFNSKREITITPLERTITNTDINWGGRFLSVGPNIILYTGGKSNFRFCCLINIETKEKTIMPEMQNGRRWHAMTWIHGHPAVIGGSSKSKALDKRIESILSNAYCESLDEKNNNKATKYKILTSVEVLINNRWVVYPSVNIGRSNATAVCNHKNVYVIGGNNPKRVEAIEKFIGTSWKILKIKLPLPADSIGVLCTGNDLLLVGGQVRYNIAVDKSFYYDTKCKNFLVADCIEDKCHFFQNNWCIEGNKIRGLRIRSSGEVQEVQISYRLKI
ncbi:hypothetical protein SteCoe_37983 [Stentor coeruleus]|uniref:Uncharacterized protein n=1 Tax=Stentor coeruleus TaxID=5963 RepID=A0A1R2AM18_9CILI|nr:hypothetical protein SteCoe_38052 [Stentor coeruleus]OMJ65567.1 hypothetical protein SteCoe_37983 [Stentor coeruleus]